MGSVTTNLEDMLYLSDSNLKEDISTLSNALPILQALRPVQFRWMEDAPTVYSGQPDVGFVAQEVAKVFPFAHKKIEILGTPFHMVRSEKLIPLLVSVCQEYAARIELLEQMLLVSNSNT